MVHVPNSKCQAPLLLRFINISPGWDRVN